MTVTPIRQTASTDAQIATYEHRLASRPAAVAKSVAAAAGTMARAGAGRTLSRVVRGFVMFVPDQFYLLSGGDMPVLPEGADPKAANDRITLRKSVLPYRRRVAAGVLLAGAGWASGGWLALGVPTCILVNAVLVLVASISGATAWSMRAKVEHCWRTATPWIAASGVPLAALWANWQMGVPIWKLALIQGLAFAAFVTYAAGPDGTTRDNGPAVQHVDVVAPNVETAGGVVAALAEPLRVKLEDVTSKFLVVNGDLTWDANHRWRELTVQMSGKTVEDANKVKSAIAGNLRIPADWLLLDEGTNASQLVMHMAASDPWPNQPTPSPMLATLAGDVWAPQRVGLDLIGSVPREITLVASSIAIGGDTGTGKTALWRLLATLVLSDRRAVLDAWDFKGDGALSMFRPLAETYSSSDDDEATEAFLAFLLDRKRDLGARAALLAELGEKDRSAVPDAKITRALAHRTDIDLRPRFVMVDEFQDAIAHPKYGEEITELLVHLARKGRSGGTKLVLATQNWDIATVPQRLTKVLSTRISLRQPDYPGSAQILGGKACKYRADLLPPVKGAAIIRPAGDGAALTSPVRLLLDYVDTVAAEDAVRRLIEVRRSAGVPVETSRPEPPRVLVELHRLVSEPSRQGRMLSREAAAAMVAYGLIEVTDADRVGGKTDEQIRQEKLAALVAPFNVRTRPDRDRGNAMAYWLDREHRDYGQVGVGPALARAARGISAPISAGVSGASPTRSPRPRRLRAV
jgi:hypothetical protein